MWFSGSVIVANKLNVGSYVKVVVTASEVPTQGESGSANCLASIYRLGLIARFDEIGMYNAKT